MSRHHFETRHSGRRVRVVAGYDRPLDEFFLQILVAPSDDDAEDEFVYMSLCESGTDWTELQALTDRLAVLNIEPPATFLPAILEDRRRQIGNRLAFHHFDRDPEIRDF